MISFETLRLGEELSCDLGQIGPATVKVVGINAVYEKVALKHHTGKVITLNKENAERTCSRIYGWVNL